MTIRNSRKARKPKNTRKKHTRKPRRARKPKNTRKVIKKRRYRIQRGMGNESSKEFRENEQQRQAEEISFHANRAREMMEKAIEKNEQLSVHDQNKVDQALEAERYHVDEVVPERRKAAGDDDDTHRRKYTAEERRKIEKDYLAMVAAGSMVGTRYDAALNVYVKENK